MSQVWRVRLLTGKAGVDQRRSKQFALEQGLVGAGWGLDDGPYAGKVEDRSADLDEYLLYARLTFPHDVSLERAAARVGRDMSIGDICWTYNAGDGQYWAGLVTSPAYYRQGGVFDEFDLHLLRDCRWVSAGSSAEVPEVVVKALTAPFGTITRIVKGAEEAERSARALLS